MNLFILLLATACQAINGINVASYKHVISHDAPTSYQHISVNQPFGKPALEFPEYNTNNLGNSYFSAFIPQSGAPVSPFGSSYGGADMCPLTPAACQKSKYRTLDGSCNNLGNPSWGTAINRYGRLLPPIYSDGVSAIPVSVTGQDLPNARLISLVVFGEADVPDPQFTLANMQWGQIITHDMSMQAGSRQSKPHATRCCTPEGKLVGKETAHTSCYPIMVPKNDPAHSKDETECMNFVRTQTDRDRNCPGHNGAAEQMTVVTAYMDLSLVYGNSEQQLQPIRAFQSGRMLVEQRLGQEWPPQNPNASTTCDGNQGETCYLTGDVRVNQNPGLTIMQIILLREHNLIADSLYKLNPHWDDEKLFQEARRINIGQYQHINYWEWLPIFLGEENMVKNRLLYKTTPGSYVNDYDGTVDPSVLNEHATAAFRYFHSQIEGRLDLISEARSRVGSLRLSDWFNRPAILESGNNYDHLSRGLATQPEELTDINFDREIKHYLFRNGRPFGRDLRAIDIQRNRDHGLATYNDFRQFCGLKRASQWEDFLDLISPQDVNNLKSLYPSHEDVDLTVGASLEAHVSGALAGPTFLCILTEQFYRTRVGDRFFYEHGSQDVAFSREQLQEIRKASMARLFCNNVNDLQSIQPQAFWRVSDSNQIVPCNLIPAIDLSQWKDHSFGGEYQGEGYYPGYGKK